MATLNDLLMGAGGGAPPAMVYPIASQPMGGFDSALYEQAFSPPDIGQRPEVSKPNRLAQVLMGLGDALNSSASVLGRSDVRSHNLQSYMDYLEGQKQSAESFDRLKASQKSESTRDKAKFLLGREEQKQIAAQEAMDKKNALREKEALDKITRERAIEDETTKRQQVLSDEARERQQQIEDADRKFGYDKVLAGIRASDDSANPDAKHDKKALFGEKGVMAAIGGLAMSAEKNIAEGATTIEELDSLINQRIEQEGLSPAGEEAARKYYEMKFAPVLRKLEVQEMNANPQGPTQPNTFWNPLRALGRARANR